MSQLDQFVAWHHTPMALGFSRHRPGWQLVLIGAVAKIHPASLPQAPNIHYLGLTSYQELPSYLAGFPGEGVADGANADGFRGRG